MSEDSAREVEDARKLFAGACDFIWGTGDINSLPPQRLTEVAFVGRSNAGKSSLINALTNRKALARVSNTPGRTREINFFDLGGKLVLADLPGYGYAKASKAMSAEWQRLIFAYLRGRANLQRVIVLVDSRRGIMDTDEAAMKLLDEAAVSYIVVLTKTDELKKGEFDAVLAGTEAAAKKHTAAYPQVLATSSLAKTGLDPLKVHIAALAAP